RVVAEGVENLEVLDALRQGACDFGQGYFFARPLPEPEFRAWLVENNFQIAQGKHPLATDRHTDRHRVLAATG
ncbi:MAG: EAL domain-containing protein, partial [Actinomycetota bacterium]